MQISEKILTEENDKELGNMNRERRHNIEVIIRKFRNVLEELECERNDEERIFENIPENLQGSLRGEESQEAIEIMNDAIAAIEEAMEMLASI